MYFVYSSMIVVGSFHVEETVSQQTRERPFLQPGTRTRLSTEMIFVVFFLNNFVDALPCIEDMCFHFI